MRKIGAAIALCALASTLSAASPAAAFGLRIGPFHIGLPTPWYHRHHHPLYARATPDDVDRSEAPSAQNAGQNVALLYPNAALPAIFQNIFWPAYSSSWPFGYQAIFTTAFAKAPNQSALCQPVADNAAPGNAQLSDNARPDGANPSNGTAANGMPANVTTGSVSPPNGRSDNSNLTQTMIGRLSEELNPTSDQMPLVQKLGGAMGAASAVLAKSCPSSIPAQPVARLQLMQAQLQQLAVALDMIRQPLQDLAQTLNDDQRAKFDAIPAAIADRKQTDMALASCASSSGAIDWSIDQINRSVQPTDAQRNDVNSLKDAFSQAAVDLQAHCPTAMPATPFARLETIEARLDATWRSVLSIQVALSNFETKLSYTQKDHFDRMNFVAR
jgi:hypothetical protein